MENVGQVDTSAILRALEAGEHTLAYLNSHPITELNDDVKDKINSTALSYQVFQARLFNSRTTRSNKLDEVWEGLAMLEFMFSKCIKLYDDIDQLGCTVCKEMFPCTQNALRKHVESGKHLRKYSYNVQGDFHEYWNNENEECAMLKYGKFVDFDGPNGMLFCRVCSIEVENDKLELLKHFKENRHQEMFEDIVSDITRTKHVKIGVFSPSGSQNETSNNPGSSSPLGSSKSAESPSSNFTPSTKKSFTRKLVDDHRNEKVKGDILNKMAACKAKNTVRETIVNPESRERTSSSSIHRMAQNQESNNPGSSSPLGSSKSAESPSSNFTPSTKKSFTRKLVDDHRNEKVKGDILNKMAACKAKNTVRVTIVNPESRERTSSSSIHRMAQNQESNNPGSSSPLGSSKSTESSSSDFAPPTKKSFIRILVDAHCIEKVPEVNLNKANNIPSKQRNFTKKLAEDVRFWNAQEEILEDRGPSSSLSSSGSSATSRRIPTKNMSFTRKLVESHRTEVARKVEVSDSENSDSSSCGSHTNPVPLSNSMLSNKTKSSEAQSVESKQKRHSGGNNIEFGAMRKMSEIHRMYFNVESLDDTIITPLGITDVPIDIPKEEIAEAFDHLGEVLHVERQVHEINVLIYIILSGRFKNIFSMNMSVRIGVDMYKIINPFLYTKV